MAKQIISASSFIAAFDDCVAALKDRQRGLDKKYVVIVPDKYTLYAERRLFEGGGAFDLEVVTFNRLISKCGCRPDGYISRFGAIMLLKKLLGDGKELNCFKRSVQFAGFAEKMYDTISQLIASSVTPQMLTADGGSGGTPSALLAKTEDVKLIYQKYLQAVEGRYVDASGLLKLLPRALEQSGYLDGAQVFVLNFDRLTALHREAIDAIERWAKSLTVYEVALKQDAVLKENSEITVYAAPDLDSELKAAAARIFADVYENGCRYRDICVVSAAADYGSVLRVFSSYGIPFSLDKKYPLIQHPAARFLLCALDAADSRLSRKKLIALAKNALTGLIIEESAAFENYCNGYRVEYKGFLQPFNGKDGETAERARQAVLSIIMPLRAALKPFMTASDFSAALKRALEGRVLCPQPQLPYDLEAMSDKLHEIIELMERVMGGGEFPLSMLSSTFTEGLKGCEISYLPALSDCVAVGPPALFRGQKFKRVIAVGFNEGVLPLVTQDCGVITDGEIDSLSRAGAAIEPKTEEVNDRARSELLHLLNGCDRLFLSYTSWGGELKPAALLKLIAASNPVVKSGLKEERARLLYGGSPRLLERLACRPAAAKELFLNGLGLKGERPEYLSTLALALGSRADGLLETGITPVHTLAERGSVFFKKGTAYISQIQTYFSCPYRHFLEYGLRLKERPDGTVSPKDVGIILHRIAELYVSGGRFDRAETEAERLFDYLLDGEFSAFGNAGEGALTRLKRESVRLCRTIAAQFNNSSYRALGGEMLFAPSGGALKSIRAPLSGGRGAAVVGVIDRVDVCGVKARVVDYKTGYVGKTAGEAFPLKKLYYGVKIQLPLYAHILRLNGYEISGMFYFPVGADWADDNEYCRMTGAFDSSVESVLQMDSSLGQGGKSSLFNVSLKLKKDGSLSPVRNSLAFGKEQLDAVCDYAAEVFCSGLEDIDDGVISALPYSDGSFTACDYCPYRCVCARLGGKKYRKLGGDVSRAVLGGKDGTDGDSV